MVMKHLFRASFLLVLLAFAPLGLVSAGTEPRLVVVVAKGSPIVDISRADLRQVFLVETTVVNGHKVIPFNFENKAVQRIAFDRIVLGMAVDEIGRFWVDRKIRGQRPAPRAVPSVAYMVKLVQIFPGALGYLWESELPASIQPVTIGGISYKDPRYPLKQAGRAYDGVL
jgi:hypothetical protein